MVGYKTTFHIDFLMVLIKKETGETEEMLRQHTFYGNKDLYCMAIMGH